MQCWCFMGEKLKEENKQNSGPIKLGTLTPELLKKLSEQMGNSENGFKETQLLNLEAARQLEALESYNKEPQANQHWRLATPEAMRDLFQNTEIEHDYPVKLTEPIDFNFLELTINQIKELPTEELYKFLSGESHSGLIRESTIQLISNEILSRQINEASKPHWTSYVGLFFSIVAAISAIIAIIY